MRTEEKKVYIKWSPEKVAEALRLLEMHSPKRVGEIMGVAADSVRLALRRKGVTIKAFRRDAKKNKKFRRKNAFVKPSGGCRPLAAMRTIEADTGGCRWPIGDLDTDSLRFCCHEKARGSFCKAHAPIAYVGDKPIPLAVWLAQYEARQAATKWHTKKG